MPGPLPHYSLKDCHFARSLCCKDRPVASLSDELIFKIQARLPLSILPVSSLTPGCVRGLLVLMSQQGVLEFRPNLVIVFL